MPLSGLASSTAVIILLNTIYLAFVIGQTTFLLAFLISRYYGKTEITAKEYFQ